ncbi:MAG TPA: isochorismate synthase [Acidimicrobiales bacterium]|nr:isochorismate synthase [Acidimicrobiales bacterium]
MSAASLAPAGLASRTRALPEGTDPLTAFAPGGFAWLHEGAGFVASGVAARIPVGTGPDRLARAAEDVAALLGAVDVDDPVDLPETGPLAVGALPFLDAQEGQLVVPAQVVGRTGDGQAWITEIGPADAAPARAGVARLEPTSFVVEADGGRRAWTTAVTAALERIAAGRLTKVVLARRVAVWGDQPFVLRGVVDRLRQAHPSCFTFAAPVAASGAFVGASPELLVRRRGHWVWSRPMAGSAERGGSRAADRRLVSELRSSPKELDEHRQVVEDVRARLEAVCREVFVKGPHPVELSSVTHLTTTVSGRLQPPAPSALALAGLLHPTPAVGGQPRDAALDAISELEGFDRGLYAGPTGWVDRRGDGDWAVALRCAEVDGRRAVLSAGAGIVAGSDPEAEWAETQAKLEPMMRALVRV